MKPEVQAAAFNLWMQRYINEPREFKSQWEAIKDFLAERTQGREPTYGEICTAYFAELCGEVSAAA